MEEAVAAFRTLVEESDSDLPTLEASKEAKRKWAKLRLVSLLV